MSKPSPVVWDESVRPRLAPLEGGALAIGTFDGVHLGHQAIVRQMCRQARAGSRRTAVLTFHPHPRMVVTPLTPPKLLTSLEERVACLQAAGQSGMAVGILQFTPAFAGLSARTFVQEVLHGQLQAGAIYVGFNFRFGRHRGGDVEGLRQLGERLAMDVNVIPPVRVGGQPVSSSLIRQHLREGRPGEASRLLGRPYSLSGKVVQGEGRGRALGFPTANLQLAPERLLPGDGVYSVDVALPGGAAAAGVCNIGTRPTFGKGRRQLEVHLLDFDGDLYGAVLKVAFLQRLREERSFSGPASLQAQLKKDIAEARRQRESTGAPGS